MTMTAQGEVLAGRYRLTGLLGCGGMGRVWAARDELLGRTVAAKEVLPPPELPPGERAVLRDRTFREARAAARVCCSSAIKVYDIVEDNGLLWIVMQKLGPRSLADVLRDEGPLPPAVAARIGLRLLDALAAAHRAGVLHRDVKPANVMFTDDGLAVLTDFGVAAVEGDPPLTMTGMLVGSPAYMAPERACGRPPTEASDLWSLGVTLFTAVEGRPPFQRPGHLSTLTAVVHEKAPPATRAGALGPVIERLLAKDPAERPEIAELGVMLAEVAAEEAAATAEVPAAVGPRRPAGVLLAAAAAAAVIGTVVPSTLIAPSGAPGAPAVRAPGAEAAVVPGGGSGPSPSPRAVTAGPPEQRQATVVQAEVDRVGPSGRRDEDGGSSKERGKKEGEERGKDNGKGRAGPR